jgi:hypothetical protein
MTRAGILTVTAPFAALLVGCSELPPPTAPEAASLAPSFSVGGPQILMLDACDPVSFNAVLGPGTCTRGNAQGGIPFSTFVSLLEKNGEVNAWRFAPDVIRVTRTVTFNVPNRGGIPHSFTEVAEFGGGFIPFLNFLSGNPVPAPECVDPGNPFAPNPNITLVAPGDHDHVTIEPGQAKKYMCCIHPWMRAVSM